MKQLFLLLAFAIAVLSTTAQQKKFSIGPYLDGALSFGELATINKAGYGGGARASFTLTPRFSLQLAAGYLHFKTAKGHDNVRIGDIIMDMDYPNPKINAIPVKLGLRYELPAPFYVQADAGAVIFLDNHFQDEFPGLHYNREDDTFYTLDNRYNKGATFTLAPAVGVHVSKSVAMDLRYEHWFAKTPAGFMALRAALSF
ncbi:hypothetical protein DCC81_16960 [Chitinophaga parva]|uniref:Outer membrane protein beta-barrel domain-containing protein n=1 Tax=Chitinophaga parva TaxID=2169414 RepID=A0A2T7BI38_9BACT|nr:outer membrane beta-barrel protein [Chitinophaga parva]PUZ25934.1 hypothetical protein DCC81_16960 [Chitinophaga parva]